MTDIASLNIRINSLEAKAAKQDLDRLTGAGQKTEQQMSTMSKAAARLGTALAAAFSTYQLTQFIKTATLAYARFETLGVVMNTVGRNAGYSADQMAGFEEKLRLSGIAMTETRATLTRMTQAQIDLTKSSELARIAQDAAVIGNINSSQAFERMIHGIQSAQVEVLRTIGLNVNFEQSYKKLADQLGKTSADLTEVEKTQARVNVVMEAGTRIAGVYEAAMDTAGKKFGSMSRHVDDLMVVIGKTFNQTFSDGIDAVTEILKSTRSWVEENEKLLQMGFDEGLSKTVDILKILVVLIGARLTASLAQSSGALAFQTQQWAAYQLALARGAGLSRTVAAGQVAMAAAVGVGSRALALVGGPAGAATLAGIAIYNFREELHLVPPDADKAVSAVDKLTGSLKNLTAAQVENRRFQILDEIDKQVENLNRLKAEYDRVAAIAGADGMMYGKADEGSKKLAALAEDIEKVEGAINKLNSTLGILEIFPTAKNDAENLRRVANAMDYARGKIPPFKKETGGLSEEARKAAEQLKEVKKAIDELGLSSALGMFETYDFSKVADDRVVAELQAAETSAQIWKEKHEEAYALQKRLAQVSYDELSDLDRRRIEQAKNAEEQARQEKIRKENEAAEKIEKEWERVYDDMHRFAADTFYDIFDGQLDSFEDFADSMLDIFKRMLANMAAEAAMTNIFKPIMNSMAGSTLGNLFGLPSAGVGSGLSLPGLGSVLKYGGSLLGFGSSAYGAAAGNAAFNAGIGYSGSIGQGFAGAPTGGVGATGGLGASVAGGAFFALAGLALNKIIGSMTADKPQISFAAHNQGDPAGYFPGSGWAYGMKSSQFDYRVGAKDQSSDPAMGQALFDYFDAMFSGIEELTSIEMNNVLRDHQNFLTGVSGGDIKALSNQVFDELIGSMLLELFPDAGSITVADIYRTGRYAKVPSGRDGLSTRRQPIYGDRFYEASTMSQYFNDDFFKTITPEGGTQWDAFAQFASVVENTSGFIDDFTRRIDDLGQTAIDAYQQIQAVTGIMMEMDSAVTVLTGSDTITAMTSMVNAWEQYIEVMRQAQATQEQLTEAEAKRNLVLGSQISGISGTSIVNALKSGKTAGDIAADALQGVIYEQAAQQIFADLAPTIEAMGQQFFATGADLEAARAALETYTPIIQEMVGGLDDLVDLESDLTAARERSAQSIQDLIRELEGGQYAPVQSMEYYERQYDAARLALETAQTPDAIAAATKRLIDIAPDYLEFGAAYAGDRTGIYNEVVGDLRNYTTPNVQPVQNTGNAELTAEIRALINQLASGSDVSITIDQGALEQLLKEGHITLHRSDEETHIAVRREVA